MCHPEPEQPLPNRQTNATSRAVDSSAQRRWLRFVLVLTAMASAVLLASGAPSRALAQCSSPAELSELSIRGFAILLDEVAVLDRQRLRETYGDEAFLWDSWQRFIPTWTKVWTWHPGDPWLEIPIYATEQSDITILIDAKGTCIGNVVQVDGPSWFTRSAEVGWHGAKLQNPFMAPHHPAMGRAEYHLYARTGELLAVFYLDLDVMDSEVRVAYGPAAEYGDVRLTGYPSSIHNRFDEPPAGLDPPSVAEKFSHPIVSHCWAGPWTIHELSRYVLRQSLEELSPRPPEDLDHADILRHVCMSFAQCMPSEARMELSGNIPPSMYMIPEFHNNIAFLWNTPGTFSRIEFVPTEEDIGEWDMTISCRDNEGNYHERPWRVIVTSGPMLQETTCSGCSGSGASLPFSTILVLLAAGIAGRRRR